MQQETNIPNSQFGKTCMERSAATKERTSELSSKSSAKSAIRQPRCLRLTRGGGLTQISSVETDGALLTDFLTLNTGESPSVVAESTLSQILILNAPEKYYLSEKACEGILRRAERRGKALPTILKLALEQQIARAKHTHSKSGGGIEVDSSGKKAGKGALIQKELSATLGVSQDQTLFQPVIVENHHQDSRVKIREDGVVQTLPSRMGTGGNNVPMVMFSKHHRARSKDDFETWGASEVTNTLNTFDQGDIRATDIVVCLEGNGQRPSHLGDGYKESDKMYTLNATEVHGVAYCDQKNDPEFCYWDGSQIAGTLTANNAGGSQRMPDKENFNCVIAIDRAAFNQGQNAQFDIGIDGGGNCSNDCSERAGCGLLHETVGALCATDYKFPQQQQIEQGKYVIEVRK